MERGGFEIRPARLGDEGGLVDVTWRRWQDTYGHHLGPDYFSKERREQWIAGWRDILAKAAAPGESRAVGSSADASPADASPAPTRRFVAVAGDGRIVGIALVAPPATQGHPDIPPVREMELHMLYVASQVQGHGVAQQLVEAVLPHAQPAQLWVSADNGRAQAFYRKSGFAADGAEGTYGGMIPEIRMVR